MQHIDVAVVGGGPVGSFLAGELAAAGVRVAVLEREAAPDPLLRGVLGARGLNGPSATALARRGLVDEVRANAIWWIDPRVVQEAVARGESPFIGHFGGIPLQARFLDERDPDFSRDVHGAGAIRLLDLERILAADAERLGARIVRGVTVDDFAEDDDGVRVGEFRASILVGCDGGRSAVRKRAGFAFPGTDAENVGRIAIARLERPIAPCEWTERPGGWLAVGPGSDARSTRLHLVETVERSTSIDRSAAVTADEIEGALRRITGEDARVTELVVGSRYTDAARQVTEYRRGRIVLAGDAAHVHSPAGGQGLNQGIGDAVALAPRVVDVVRGAPLATLDAYGAERGPIGAAVLDYTRAQSALNRRDPFARALRRVVAELLASTPSTMTVVKRLAGVRPS